MMSRFSVFPHKMPAGCSDSQSLPGIRYASAPLIVPAGSAIFADVFGGNSGECVG